MVKNYKFYIYSLLIFISLTNSKSKKGLIYNIYVYDSKTASTTGNLLESIYNFEDCFVINISKNREYKKYYDILNHSFLWIKNSNIHLVSFEDNKKNTITFINSNIEAFKYSIKKCSIDWSHLIIIDGDTYPLKQLQKIRNYYLKNEEKNFIQIKEDFTYYLDRPIENFAVPLNEDLNFEDNLFVLSNKFIDFITEDKLTDIYLKIFSTNRYPHKFFYISLLLNSKFKNTVTNKKLIYQQFTNGTIMKNLLKEDINDAINSKCFYAAKVRHIEVVYYINKKMNIDKYHDRRFNLYDKILNNLKINNKTFLESLNAEEKALINEITKSNNDTPENNVLQKFIFTILIIACTCSFLFNIYAFYFKFKIRKYSIIGTKKKILNLNNKFFGIYIINYNFKNNYI